MKLFVNNEIRDFDQTHLSDLLTEVEIIDKKGVAVAVNNKVVPKTAWKDQVLNENDKITIIKATQGG